MIEMRSGLQKEFLENLRKKRPNDLQFSKDLDEIMKEVQADESDSEKAARVEAETRVKRVVMEFGEPIGHGDLFRAASGYKKQILKYWSKILVRNTEY